MSLSNIYYYLYDTVSTIIHDATEVNYTTIKIFQQSVITKDEISIISARPAFNEVSISGSIEAEANIISGLVRYANIPMTFYKFTSSINITTTKVNG